MDRSRPTPRSSPRSAPRPTRQVESRPPRPRTTADRPPGRTSQDAERRAPRRAPDVENRRPRRGEPASHPRSVRRFQRESEARPSRQTGHDNERRQPRQTERQDGRRSPRQSQGRDERRSPRPIEPVPLRPQPSSRRRHSAHPPVLSPFDLEERRRDEAAAAQDWTGHDHGDEDAGDRPHPLSYARHARRRRPFRIGSGAFTTDDETNGPEGEPDPEEGPPPLARCCFVGDPSATTWAGRSLRELILGARGLEFPTSIQAATAYGHCPDLPLPPLVARVARRPPTGRVRLVCGPAAALPPEVDRGIYWALTTFDPLHPTAPELAALRAPELVFLPTEQHRDRAIAGGLPAEKIALAPVGVNARVFHDKAAPADFLAEEDGFIFVTVTSPLQRKGLDLLLRAYLEEFKAAEPVLLIVKLAHPPKPRKRFSYEIPDLAQRLGALNRLLARVLVVDDPIADEMLAALLARADAYVCANRSFHTALTVREAMACGRPVIGPAPLQSLVGLDDRHGFLVPTVPFSAPAGFLFADSPPIELEEPDLGALRRCLREAFTDRAATRAKGREARRLAQKTFADWREGSRCLADRLASVPRPRRSSAPRAGAAADAEEG